jgi:hypothetical protein
MVLGKGHDWTQNCNASDMIRRLSPSVIFLLVALVAFDPHICQGQTKPDSRDKELDTERKKLAKEKDPADRAESLMKIADITLTYLRDSATANDAGQVESYTQLYWETVSQARNEMMLSGLNPYKKPKGYQAVETGVRRQTRVLQEIARSLNLQARKPVEAAIEGVSKVRDEMLKALFK